MVSIAKIKADIKSGKCKAIYLSDKFLWWTHLESDVIEATEKGIYYLGRFSSKPNLVSQKILSGEYFDPLGGKININKNPMGFIETTLKHAKHYGKWHIQAFLKAHHQNCGNFFSNKWEGYNNLIDRQKKETI